MSLETRKGCTILVGEDEPEVRSYIEMALRCQGYAVKTAQDGDEVLSLLEGEHSIAAVLLDIVMPGKDGMETLREIRSMDKDLPVVMLSGASSPLNIVEAMKSGATDFLGKPVSHEEMRNVLRNALAKQPLRVMEPPERPVAADSNQTFLGNSARMRQLASIARQVGPSEAPVLIQGETGVGKEVLARHLHALSRRSNKPFLKLNCAALPSELVESELFGYERGAFTGAFQRKPGMFELAEHGTLLLDEIGDMDFKLQAKLLQVLQDHEFQRLGGKETIKVDVRVIAATHNDLEGSIAAGKFREDLYYRLNVINLRIPPLRERKEDLLSLGQMLLRRHAKGGAVPAFTPAMQQALLAHSWPGNVRELENVMRKLLVLGDQDMIARELAAKTCRGTVAASTPAAAPSIVPAAPILEQVTMAKQQAEREAILAALNSTHWNRKQAAALLKIDYKALLYKMKKLSIEDKLVTFPSSAMAALEDERAKVMSAGS